MNFDQDLVFSSKVLLVDPEPANLDLLDKAAKNRFELITAPSVQEGMTTLDRQGPFAVAVSCRRAPVMDGIAFLAKVRQQWPHTVRILCSAVADLEAAVEAINTSQVFRLLTSSARDQELLGAIEDGLRHHRLLVADQAHLLERERQMRAALLALPLPAMIHAEDGKVILVNRAWSELSGWSVEDLPDITAWVQKAMAGDWQKAKKHLEGLYELTDRTSEGEYGILTKQGQRQIWDFSSAPLGKLPDGRRAVISIGADVTQRRAIEDSLSRAGQVFANTTNGILVTDADGVILEANPAICEISGYSRDQLLGQTPRLFRSGRHDQDFYRAMWQSLLEQGSWRGEIWDRRQNGEIYPAWLTISRVEGGGDRSGYVVITSDLSALREAQERMDYLSRHDPLTGLPNRDSLRDRLEQALSYAEHQGRQLVVSYLDLDDFKLVNDSLGHQAGDLVLSEVAHRLRSALSEADILARWSGDHFVAASLTQRGGEYAARVAERMLNSLSESLDIQDNRLFLTASVGLSLYPVDAGQPEELVQHADTAMHEAKKQGRNRYVFFAAPMNQQVVERLSMEVDMRGALERGEFTLLYQPQVELATGRVRGLEALVRWEHPTLGLLMPDSFLPVAEESGLVVPLGRQVLEMACAQMRAWRAAGLPVELMAVNLSARQLWEEDMAATINQIMESNGCQPWRLELEVTESVIMSSVEKGVEVLGRLRASGVEVSIDDFGTGYSSLYYLKKLPFTTLKIDKSFVDDIPGDPDSTNIVASITTLAHGLGKRVVVEGVETREQMETVASFGCEMVQGFYFSRPLAPERVQQLLSRDPAPFASLIPGPA